MTESSCRDNRLRVAPLPSAPQGGPEREAEPHRYCLFWQQDTQGQPLRWQVEQEDPQRTRITPEPDQLTLESGAGLTLWLDLALSGRYRISFTREVRVAEGDVDRLSDLNQFWAAYDPQRTDLFTRRGRLDEYDNLALYYVGMGGNWNSTTRFRYYNGRGERALLGEYTDTSHLLQPNRRYRIQIEVDARETRFLVDDVIYFRAHYLAPPAVGYFGFRTVFSHQIISNFVVSRE